MWSQLVTFLLLSGSYHYNIIQMVKIRFDHHNYGPDCEICVNISNYRNRDVVCSGLVRCLHDVVTGDKMSDIISDSENSDEVSSRRMSNVISSDEMYNVVSGVGMSDVVPGDSM